MDTTLFVAHGAGRTFKFATDTITIQAADNETVDSRSIMHWVSGIGGFSPNHTHERYEETFHVLEGEVEFTLGTDTFVMRTGDFVRVPPRTRHGFRNKSGRPVPMIVTLSPGGMAELFYAYRSDSGSGKGMAAYIQEARDVHGTVYELPSGE